MRDNFEQEGGLRAPPGLGFWGKAWWWFHFLILVKLARLRFLVVLLVIGLVIVKWETLIKHYERWMHRAEHDQAAGSGYEWFCPMHPAIVRDNPRDKCPICFMPLSKRKLDERAEEALPPGIVSRVQLSPYRIVLAGVQTWTVAAVPVRKEVSAVGFVEFNEREMKQVAARLKGRIDKLFVSETGKMVHAGDELAAMFSPDIIVAMQNLVDAQRMGNAEVLKSVQDRLLRWGMSDAQLADILKTRTPGTHLKISSPITGHVLKKFVKEGQYVEEGAPLYDIVDLATVWIQAQVYEDDMAYLPGNDCPIKDSSGKRELLSITATTRAYPNDKFEGRLTFVLPHVDPETRSVVVRFELANPEHKLRPGTSVTVKLQVPPPRLPALAQAWARSWQQRSGVLAGAQALTGAAWGLGFADALPAAGELAQLAQGQVLVVPESAVIDTGSQKLVYREVLPGEYEGVAVELGSRLLGPNDVLYFPVLAGLGAGDRVVTSGSFLIDAETRLNPAAASTYFGSSGTSKATPSTVRPSTLDQSDGKIRAALAKLGDKDRRLAEQQNFCAVNNESRLGSMGVPVKLMIQGQPVFLCCEGCRDEALANPARSLERVNQLRKTHSKK